MATIVNRYLLTEDPTNEYGFSDELIEFMANLEDIAKYMSYYSCYLQSLFYKLATSSLAELQAAYDAFTAQKLAEDKANASKSASVPNFTTSGLPGFSYPTYIIPALKEVTNTTVSTPTKSSLSEMITSIFCGNWGKLFNWSMPCLSCLLNLPDLNANVDLNLRLDPCIERYMPPMMMPKIRASSLTLGGGSEKGVYNNNSLLSSNFGTGFGANDKTLPTMSAYPDEVNSLSNLSKSALSAIGAASTAIGSAIQTAMQLPGMALNGVAGVFGSSNSNAGEFEGIANGAVTDLTSAQNDVNTANNMLYPSLASAGVRGASTQASNLINNDTSSLIFGSGNSMGALGYLTRASLTLAKVTGNMPAINGYLSKVSSGTNITGTSGGSSITSNLTNQIGYATGSVSSATSNVTALGNKLNNLTKSSGLC